MSRPLKILLVAAEASGDALGAGLAVALMARLGAEVPTIQFMQKQLAEFYDPAKGGHVEKLPTIALETTAAGKFWDRQDFIFLTVDKQLGHFWALVEAWARLVA